jgi:hypothetical protein
MGYKVFFQFCFELVDFLVGTADVRDYVFVLTRIRRALTNKEGQVHTLKDGASVERVVSLIRGKHHISKVLDWGLYITPDLRATFLKLKWGAGLETHSSHSALAHSSGYPRNTLGEAVATSSVRTASSSGIDDNSDTSKAAPLASVFASSPKKSRFISMAKSLLLQNKDAQTLMEALEAQVQLKYLVGERERQVKYRALETSVHVSPNTKAKVASPLSHETENLTAAKTELHVEQDETSAEQSEVLQQDLAIQSRILVYDEKRRKQQETQIVLMSKQLLQKRDRSKRRSGIENNLKPPLNAKPVVKRAQKPARLLQKKSALDTPVLSSQEPVESMESVQDMASMEPLEDEETVEIVENVDFSVENVGNEVEPHTVEASEAPIAMEEQSILDFSQNEEEKKEHCASLSSSSGDDEPSKLDLLEQRATIGVVKDLSYLESVRVPVVPLAAVKGEDELVEYTHGDTMCGMIPQHLQEHKRKLLMKRISRQKRELLRNINAHAFLPKPQEIPNFGVTKVPHKTNIPGPLCSVVMLAQAAARRQLARVHPPVLDEGGGGTLSVVLPKLPAPHS